MKMKGFTLPELLIATTIAVMVVGLLMAIMVNNTSLYYKQSSKANDGVEINDASSIIATSIKEANSVAKDYLDSFISNSDTLILKVPSINEDGIIQDSFDYVVYYKTGDKLKKQVFPNDSSIRGSEDRILTTVSDLNFEYFGVTGMEVNPEESVDVKVTLTINENVAISEGKLRND